MDWLLDLSQHVDGAGHDFFEPVADRLETLYKEPEVVAVVLKKLRDYLDETGAPYERRDNVRKALRTWSSTWGIELTDNQIEWVVEVLV